MHLFNDYKAKWQFYCSINAKVIYSNCQNSNKDLSWCYNWKNLYMTYLLVLFFQSWHPLYKLTPKLSIKNLGSNSQLIHHDLQYWKFCKVDHTSFDYPNEKIEILFCMFSLTFSRGSPVVSREVDYTGNESTEPVWNTGIPIYFLSMLSFLGKSQFLVTCIIWLQFY